MQRMVQSAQRGVIQLQQENSRHSAGPGVPPVPLQNPSPDSRAPFQRPWILTGHMSTAAQPGERPRDRKQDRDNWV